MIIKNTKDKAGSIIGNKGILIKESLYDTVNKIVKDQIGIENQIYLPYLYSLFLLILTSNIIGLVPYNFTSTSHLEMQDDSILR
jgi:F0F1-type ATP synthase membrane subunit a